MKKIVIGIHGLGNKPPRRLFRTWWKRSLRDGLKKIGTGEIFLPFELVYWADILHPIPLDPRQKDTGHPLYLDEKYVKPPREEPKPVSTLKGKFIESMGRTLDKIFWDDEFKPNFSFISDLIIRRYFSEFETYYSKTVPKKNGGDCPVKTLIRQRLLRVLKRHRNKEIFLIAHSMGSVIAFDVLLSASSEVTVDTLVTIGSPLGLPMVVHRIYTEHYAGKGPFVPESIRCPDSIRKHWFNFSDIEDKVALDHRLFDDFQPNIYGVRPTDTYVRNDYAIAGVKNPHKDYGYLRTPKMARVLESFLRNP